ncbi:GNAT family N-acetyltransferase [Acinetobacter sp. ANC 4558]|uniref:GNAT family N-acetyltransferase n=1 Tax=Acinetobacter sp. ANC 4558 TaxID=1977876 RepID=UPI003A1010CD
MWSKEGIIDYLNQDFSLASLTLSLNDKNQLWFILFDENQIPQGFAKINFNKYNPNLKQIGTELQKFYLLDAAILKKMSQQFFQYILRFLHEKNYKFIYLEVLNNNIRAQKFYKKYHFEHALETSYATDLYDLGMIVMTLTL